MAEFAIEEQREQEARSSTLSAVSLARVGSNRDGDSGALGGSRRLRRAIARRLAHLSQRLDPLTADFDRLVWQFSAPRAGSTWLMRLLASHGLVHGVNEPLIGAHLGVRMRSALEVSLEPEGELVYGWSRKHPNYILADEFAQVWRPPVQQLLRDRLLAPTLRRDGAFTVVKEPHGAEAAELLVELTPGSRVLVLMRDPRDILDSLLDIAQNGWMGQGNGRGELTPRQRAQTIDRVLWFWAWRHEAIDAAVATLPPERHMLVRYEDLRADTAGELRTIGQWLGLPNLEPWIDEAVAAHDFEAVPQEHRGAGKFHRRAEPGGWRETLTADEEALVAERLGPYMRRHGYEGAAHGT